jgi:hypothetical protein
MSDQPRGLRIVVTDLETSETQTVDLPMGEYFLVTTEPCYVSHTQVFGAGKTVQLTIKGRVLR